MHRPLTRLSSDAPRLHRFIHELASWGLNHSEVYWKLAQALAPAPGAAGLLINERYSLRLNLAAQTEQRMYEGEEQNGLLLVSRLVTPGGHCIDLGAHIGLYTVLMASRVGAQGRVITFEPCTPVGERLLAHTRELPQVTAVHGLEALSEAQGPAPIELLRLEGADWGPRVFEEAPELLRAHRVQALLTTVGPGAIPLRLLAPHFPLKEYAHFQVGERPSRTHLRRRPALAPVDLQRRDASRFTLLAIRRDCIGRIVDLLAP
ncbi:methyltransferase FkbM [Stigmatella erecta]|uniref:Methyltransferase, FkbM family n=1 Tax=Stigmatella erecta TaxID=83460 RepID=A0A1I0D8S8_9BACT|nr:methyltransferase FkbM [Stigmatella erecta]SET28618.1 methyltransferase, FkbM family [Stigmatella erecta]